MNNNLSWTNTPLHGRIQTSLTSRADRQMLRRLTPSKSANTIDFSSNDYLSLSQSLAVEQLFRQHVNAPWFKPYGPASSRLLDGNTDEHVALEKLLVEFFNNGHGEALLYNSGFDANVGIWSCLPTQDDILIYDELIHASTHDGMRKSRMLPKNRLKFNHNDMSDFEQLVQKINLSSSSSSKVAATTSGQATDKIQVKGDVWIAVETLYSMDGDVCPLDRVVEILDRYLPSDRYHLVVDEAHSSGIYGLNGRGIAHAFNLTKKIRIRIHTFGKAFACSGGVVLCDGLIRSFLINYSRPLIFSTAAPRINTLAVSVVIQHLKSGAADLAISHLHNLSRTLVRLLSNLLIKSKTTMFKLQPSIDLEKSKIGTLPPSPIIPIITSKPRDLCAHLMNSKRFLTRPITYPTVPKGSERVRVCIHSGNTLQEIHDLVKSIEDWIIIEETKSKL